MIKDAKKKITGKRQALQQKVYRNLDSYMQKNQNVVLSYTIYKYKLKMY